MIETAKTFCRICHAACPMEIDIEDKKRIVAIIKETHAPAMRDLSRAAIFVIRQRIFMCTHDT